MKGQWLLLVLLLCFAVALSVFLIAGREGTSVGPSSPSESEETRRSPTQALSKDDGQNREPYLGEMERHWRGVVHSADGRGIREARVIWMVLQRGDIETTIDWSVGEWTVAR